MSLLAQFCSGPPERWKERRMEALDLNSLESSSGRKPSGWPGDGSGDRSPQICPLLLLPDPRSLQPDLGAKGAGPGGEQGCSLPGRKLLPGRQAMWTLQPEAEPTGARVTPGSQGHDSQQLRVRCVVGDACLHALTGISVTFSVSDREISSSRPDLARTCHTHTHTHTHAHTHTSSHMSTDLQLSSGV